MSLYGGYWNSKPQHHCSGICKQSLWELEKENQRFQRIISGVAGFSFWVIEPIGKDGNGGIFRKIHFSGKEISGTLFSWVKTDYLDISFSKSWIWTEISLGGNYEGQVD